MPGLVLIVEDEPEIATVLSAYLERDGFRSQVAASVGQARSAMQDLRPELVLLDIGLPDGDGLDLLRDIRRESDLPVIMITARDEDLDKLLGFRMGADDYVVKPFSPPEVVARVAAVLRRTSRSSGGSEPARPSRFGPAGARHFGPLTLDEDGTTVTVGDAPLPLTATEYRLLQHMAREPGRTFSRDQLLRAVSPDSEALERVVDAHLANLRRKLTAAGAPELVVTVRGLGYRLDAGKRQP